MAYYIQRFGEGYSLNERQKTETEKKGPFVFLLLPKDIVQYTRQPETTLCKEFLDDPPALDRTSIFRRIELEKFIVTVIECFWPCNVAVKLVNGSGPVVRADDGTIWVDVHTRYRDLSAVGASCSTAGDPRIDLVAPGAKDAFQHDSPDVWVVRFSTQRGFEPPVGGWSVVFGRCVPDEFLDKCVVPNGMKA